MPISGFLLVIAILPPWNYSKITARVLGLASRRRTKRGDRLPLIETLVLRVPLRLMLELFEKTLGLHLADAVVVVVGHDILLVNPPAKRPIPSLNSTLGSNCNNSRALFRSA